MSRGTNISIIMRLFLSVTCPWSPAASRAELVPNLVLIMNISSGCRDLVTSPLCQLAPVPIHCSCNLQHESWSGVSSGDQCSTDCNTVTLQQVISCNNGRMFPSFWSVFTPAQCHWSTVTLQRTHQQPAAPGHKITQPLWGPASRLQQSSLGSSISSVMATLRLLRQGLNHSSAHFYIF